MLAATAATSLARDSFHNSMYGFRSSIILANWSMSRDCAPSLIAFSGAGCASTIRPSAPMATPARANAGTRLRFPVVWLGSKITGRCVNSLSAGKIPQQIATFRNHCFASDERRFQITNYIGTRLVELLTPIEQRNNHASVE